MSTGRALIENALRDPMRDLGWVPRASGWFTREVGPQVLGVIAVGVATRHSAPGAALATLYVHLRQDAIEREVSKRGGWRDLGYRTTTAVTPIGYLTPEACWREWPVDAGAANLAAAEMAAAVQNYGAPHLQRLAAHPRDLLDAVYSSPSYSTAPGLARAVLLLCRIRALDEARQLIDERAAALGARIDAAALDERRTFDWLREEIDKAPASGGANAWDRR